MKMISSILSVMVLTSLVLVGVTAQTNPYDPWADLDDDGDIDIYDIVDIAGRYGTSGIPMNKTTLLNTYRTCEFVWGSDGVQRLYITLTSPAFATPNSTIRFDLFFLFLTQITVGAAIRLEASSLQNNASWQQIYYDVVIATDVYPPGTNITFTADVTIPTNAQLCSLLNVSLWSTTLSWQPIKEYLAFLTLQMLFSFVLH